MACRVRFHTHICAHRDHWPFRAPESEPSNVSPSRSATCALTSSGTAFSKPRTSGREEEGVGRDLALSESKQKSPSTMNKSIQKKQNLSVGGRADCSQSTAVSKKKKGLVLLPLGYRATPQAAPARTSEQGKPPHNDQEKNSFERNVDVQ